MCGPVATKLAEVHLVKVLPVLEDRTPLLLFARLWVAVLARPLSGHRGGLQLSVLFLRENRLNTGLPDDGELEVG